MFTSVYNTPDRCIRTGRYLRALQSELASVPICAWFAMYYLMTGKAMKSLGDLEYFEKRLPYKHGFRQEGRLRGLNEFEYTYVLKLHGFVVNDVLRMTESSENSESLGIMLRRLLWHNGLKPGTKLFVEVDKAHAIAAKILPEGKMVLVDQVTSCFLQDMRHHQHFSEWDTCKNFVILRVEPTPETPSSRLRALVRETFDAETTRRNVERKVLYALDDVKRAWKLGIKEDPVPRASGRSSRPYETLVDRRLWLEVVEHRVEALKRLAEDAGAVFKPRPLARKMPRRARGTSSSSFKSLKLARQPLVLDRAQTARALAERDAARAAAHAAEAAAAAAAAEAAAADQAATEAACAAARAAWNV
jgi:hypothetical protein